MRIYLAAVLLLIAPIAIVFAYKEFEKRDLDPQAPQWKTRGEVLFFNATWCGPCRQMKPIVTNLRRQGYHLRDVDVDRNRDLAVKYGIRSVPTFVFLENGDEVSRCSGGMSPEHLRSLCASAAYH
ncbi:MAG TPA: thioredoxin family protein [Pirellulales bacterium]|nr:thioredoxin family protein [Pirellulales bacterium]